MSPHNSVNPTDFKSLGLIDPLLKALAAEGYESPTPIQQKAIPHVLAGSDLLGCAQTGTGKTAAFALPILQLLAKTSTAEGGARGRNVRALILTPTRELAAQIGESFDRYGAELRLATTVIFGGVGQSPQVSAVRRGVDVLVATPGRLLDLIDQRHVNLSQIEIFVLDEADRMLDMGFVNDVRKVLKLLPKKRHSLFFSATMPNDIQRLAQDILVNPVKVEVTPVATTAEKIVQSVFFVPQAQKTRLLESLLQDQTIAKALVFSRTKHGADKITRFLNHAGISAEAIHGNKSQNNRVRSLNDFKDGKVRILVATDIAARGIDIDGVTHVINYELPNVPESYVHRIGRTARAGAEGIALSFCDPAERDYLKDIEKLIRMKITVGEHTLSENLSGPYVEPPRGPRPVRGQSQGRRPAPRAGHGGGRNQGRGGGGRPHSAQAQRSSGHAPRTGAPHSADRRAPAPFARPLPARTPGAQTPLAPRAEGARSTHPHARGPRPAGAHSGGRNSRRGSRGGAGRSQNSGYRSAASAPTRSASAPATTEAPKKKSWWKKFLPDSE